MSPTLDERIEQLKHTIAEMESQRDSLGDEVVEASLAPLIQKLEQLSVIAIIYLVWDRIERIEDWTEAQEATLESIEIADRGVGNPVESRCNLSMVSVRQGKLKQALILYNEARQKARTPPNIWQEQNLLEAECELAAAEGRWSETLSAAEAVCKGYDQQELRWPWANALVEWAEIHIASGEPGDYQRAGGLYREALALFEEMEAEFYANLITERIRALSSAEADIDKKFYT